MHGWLPLTFYICIATRIAQIHNTELCETPWGYEYFIQDIMENTLIDTVIGHVIIEGNSSQIVIEPVETNDLSFDNITRNVTLKSELNSDRGAADAPVLQLSCSILGSSVQLQIVVKVIVTDWNDNAPLFEHSQHNTTISEDALVGTTIYSSMIVTDNDRKYNGNSRLSYRIVPNQTFSDYFAMEVPTLPVITLHRTLDYETVTVMTIQIEARDNPSDNRGDPKSATGTLTIYVLDADDQNPVFSNRSYIGAISEDATPGTIVSVTPRLIARDPDTMNVSVTYQLLDPYDFFTINPSTGAIRNLMVFDVDVPTVTVIVLASQVDNPNRSWFAMLTIRISEANINAPRFTMTLYRVTRLELEPIGSVLVTTTARDPDFGTVLQYAIVESADDLSIDESGNVILEQSLDYEREQQRVIRVTASDGSHTATATVEINVLDINDNNPILNTSGTEFSVPRETGRWITTVSAQDADVNNVLYFELRSYTDLFAISYLGEIIVIADPEQLIWDRYSLLVTVLDDGEPHRESSAQIDVIFPPFGFTGTTPTGTTEPPQQTPNIGASAAPDDNMIIVVIGGVTGVLLVVIIILIVYIVWRNKITKEELDRARAPRAHAAKGLTYRQAEVPDDLPKMDLRYTDDTDGISDCGRTTVQENPLRNPAVNQAYFPSSGSEMDRDVSEIEIETAVVPYDDDFGYPSGRPDFDGQFRTFHGDDTTSNESNHSDSTGGSQHALVNGSKKDGTNKMTSWDSDDKIHPQGAQKLMDSKNSTASRTTKERPEITVYF